MITKMGNRTSVGQTKQCSLRMMNKNEKSYGPPKQRKELRAPVSEEEMLSGNASSSQENPLARALKRAKIQGKGVDMVSRIANLISKDDGNETQRVGFLQVRLVGPRPSNKAKKVARKKDGERNLKFEDCPPEIQRGLKKARCAEWQKWMKFNAAVILSDEEENALRSDGVKVLPMQWIETDKNAHKRRGQNYKEVPPLLKSRLVGCGNFEDTDGLRTDSPTADVDAHNLVFSWCASPKVQIRTADITNAFLHGKPVDIIILDRVPRGGIPEEGIREGAVLAARFPIYGTRDAGRGFWIKLKEVCTNAGLALN